MLCRRYQTFPLSAGATISGSISYNLWGLESSMNANASFKVEVFRLQPDGTVTSIGSASNTTELGTSAAVRTGSFTPSSTAFVAGDVIGLMVSFVDAGGTMASGFTLTLNTGAASSGVDGDSFLTFTENLSFSTTAPSGSILYLTDTASDATSGSNTKKALQIDGSAPSTFTKVTNTAAGPTAPIQMTDGAGGTAIEWFSPQLSSSTITAGLMELSLDLLESNTAANASAVAEVYKTQADGSSPTLLTKSWLAGSGAADTGSVEITTVSADPPIVYSFPIAATSITDGERLKIILYIDDQMISGLNTVAFGTTTPTTNMGGGQTVTAQLGGSGGGYLKLPVSVTQFTPAGPRPLIAPSQAVHRASRW